MTTIRGEDYPPNLRLRQAAEKLGHGLFLINPHDFAFSINATGHQPADTSECFSLLPRDFFCSLPHVLIPRQGSTITPFSLLFTRHLKSLGIPLVNDIDPIITASSQFLTLQCLAASQIPVPDSLCISSINFLSASVKRLGGYPVIAKEMNQRQGKGVFLLKSDQHAECIVSDCLKRSGCLVLQQFVPVRGRQDVRVLVTGKRIAGEMRLIPEKNDFRANYHLNSSAAQIDLPWDLKQLALKAVSAVGLEIAGVDMIIDQHSRPMIIEVNYSPGFSGLEKITGTDIADIIIKYAASKATPPLDRAGYSRQGRQP
ncbi:MAG: RimK family alpha-L-glutamate ligase [Desulfobacteraceae bacterium]